MSEIGPPTLLAFYLPQYHPIRENDEWWGPGFTEWTNVVKAEPQFPGHYQPHVPSDLGYYDLRDPEVRQRQAVLASGDANFLFTLGWPKENWPRRWDGGERKILMGQHYSAEDDLENIRALLPALSDRRYLARDGKPILAIYRSSLLPDPRATTQLWRAEAERSGLPGLYLLCVESAGDKASDPRPFGFDAAVEFPPSWADLPRKPLRLIARPGLRWFNSRFSHYIFRYDDMANRAMARPDPVYPRWPGVTPGFDNTARGRRNATIIVES